MATPKRAYFRLWRERTSRLLRSRLTSREMSLLTQALTDIEREWKDKLWGPEYSTDRRNPKFRLNTGLPTQRVYRRPLL